MVHQIRQHHHMHGCHIQNHKIWFSMFFSRGQNKPGHWASGCNKSYLSMRLLRWLRRGFKFWNRGIHNGNQNFHDRQELSGIGSSCSSPPNLHQVYLWLSQRPGFWEVGKPSSKLSYSNHSEFGAWLNEASSICTHWYHNNHYTHLHCMFIPNIYTPLTTYH